MKGSEKRQQEIVYEVCRTRGGLPWGRSYKAEELTEKDDEREIMFEIMRKNIFERKKVIFLFKRLDWIMYYSYDNPDDRPLAEICIHEINRWKYTKDEIEEGLFYQWLRSMEKAKEIVLRKRVT